jgi:primosomal protein N' (replication factor Y) (superfamily II helicase)
VSAGRPVAVAVSIPRLELDRPFTYLLPEEHYPGTGLLVSVPFHGRTVKGYVLGPTEEVPGRVLPVRRVLSRVPLFDDRAVALYRWMSERYVTPLAVVIDRAHPPRVASEEEGRAERSKRAVDVTTPRVLRGYEHGPVLLDAVSAGSGLFAFRPLPDDEAVSCAEAVATCLRGGRDAVVIVPEAEPFPETARSLAELLGELAVLYVGGDRRERYRTWLDVQAGRYRVVIGTRPAVFAPVPRLGLIWVSREAHPGHREERAPYHRVSEVAAARARLTGAVCVLAGLVHSSETATSPDVTWVRASRARERASAPLVETARPGPEDRSPRLTQLLRSSDGAFLLVSRQGSGVARVCRNCGEPVRCSVCGGPVTVREGRPACAVCGTDAVCANCGSTRFGVDRGGTERLQEWAARVAAGPVARVDAGPEAIRPDRGRTVIGTAAAVKDFGPTRVSLVAVLDADRARRRAGLSAPVQALATWMEAAAWAGPREDGGRVLVHSREPGDPAVQALIRWDPSVLHRAERRRREDAGFPPGFPVYRVLGSPELGPALRELGPVTLLQSSEAGQTVCLVTLRPDQVARFRHRVVALAEEGVLTRVEAEPQL